MNDGSKHTRGKIHPCGAGQDGTDCVCGLLWTEHNFVIAIAQNGREEGITLPVGEMRANAHRLADCWNALDGIEDPAAALALIRKALEGAYRYAGDDAFDHEIADVAAALALLTPTSKK